MGSAVTRALVIGAGSIGERHASVLESLGHEVAFVSRRTDLPRVFPSAQAAVEQFEPEYAVVATETAVHEASVNRLAAAGYRGPLLVEKPLAVSSLTLEPFERVGVGYNLRFHPVIVALGAALQGVDIHTAEIYVGQHLSTWRPGRDHREQYSAHAHRGGGVLRDLSHEFDYLGTLLGGCLGLFARGGRVADVTVDSDDAWGIVAAYDRAPVVTVQLNYLDTRARRRLLLNTSAGTIDADLVAGTLITDQGGQTFELDRDLTYRALHEAMLDSSTSVASVDEALATERVIDMVESSAATQEWVTR